jgi:integrase
LGVGCVTRYAQAQLSEDMKQVSKALDQRGHARTCGKPSAPAFKGGLCGEICADLAHCMPRGTRFHDLRHFYASTLIAANLNPKVIRARLGHATITETMDTYGHLFPDAEDLGRGVIDAIFAVAPTQQERNRETW